MAVVENLWLVDFDRAALLDLEDVKSRGDRKSVFAAVDKLGHFGPGLSSPNMKSLKGAADLFELRPKQGRSGVRLIYARDGRRFIVLAVAPNKASFEAALRRARQRFKRRQNLR
jgi:hypothetical protein